MKQEKRFINTWIDKVTCTGCYEIFDITIYKAFDNLEQYKEFLLKPLSCPLCKESLKALITYPTDRGLSFGGEAKDATL